MVFGFTTDDWQRVDANWAAWWRGELERPLVPFVVDLPDRQGPGIEPFWVLFNVDFSMSVSELLDGCGIVTQLISMITHVEEGITRGLGNDGLISGLDCAKYSLANEKQADDYRDDPSDGFVRGPLRFGRIDNVWLLILVGHIPSQ